MKSKPACIIGPNAGKMLYDENSVLYKKLEEVLKAEIKNLIESGITEFFICAQAGVPKLAAMLIINIKQELIRPINLNLVLPYRGLLNKFNRMQKDDYNFIAGAANNILCLHENYTPGCYRACSRYMMEQCGFLIAVEDEGKPVGNTQADINTAKQKGIQTVIINPLNFRIVKDYM